MHMHEKRCRHLRLKQWNYIIKKDVLFIYASYIFLVQYLQNRYQEPWRVLLSLILLLPISILLVVSPLNSRIVTIYLLYKMKEGCHWVRQTWARDVTSLWPILYMYICVLAYTHTHIYIYIYIYVYNQGVWILFGILLILISVDSNICSRLKG